MTAASAVETGRFGSFIPFDERSAEAFFGRADEVARLVEVVTGDAHVVAFTGPSGAGKTSLLRAGLGPALSRRGFAVVTLGSYHDLERELVRATSSVGITPPVPGQDPADYLGHVSREAKGGLILILDHLEEALADEAGRSETAALVARVREEGGPRLRFL